MIIYKGFKIVYLGIGRYEVTRGKFGFKGDYPGGIAEIMRDIDDVLAYLM